MDKETLDKEAMKRYCKSYDELCWRRKANIRVLLAVKGG